MATSPPEVDITAAPGCQCVTWGTTTTAVTKHTCHTNPVLEDKKSPAFKRPNVNEDEREDIGKKRKIDCKSDQEEAPHCGHVESVLEKVNMEKASIDNVANEEVLNEDDSVFIETVQPENGLEFKEANLSLKSKETIVKEKSVEGTSVQLEDAEHDA